MFTPESKGSCNSPAGRTNPLILCGLRKHHMLPRPQAIPSDVPQKEEDLPRRPCGNLCCWTLEMEKMSVFPTSSHSRRIRKAQSASSNCGYKLILTNYPLETGRNHHVLCPPHCCHAVCRLHGLPREAPDKPPCLCMARFQRCPNFWAALQNCHDWGTRGCPSWRHKGKATQEQFHGKQVAKQVPSGPTNLRWCDDRVRIHVVPLQVRVSSTTFSSCSLPPVCRNSENLAAA